MARRRQPPYPTDVLAHQLAGQAAVAHEHKIHIFQAGLSFDLKAVSVSQFQRFSDYCGLELGEPKDVLAIDRYLQFLMAGSVASMLFHEEFWRIEDRPRRLRFRNRWFELAWATPSIELDFAYFVIAAWLPVGAVSGLARECHTIWQRTLRLMDCPSFWNRVSGIAFQMLDNGAILDADDIAEAMRIERE